MIVAIAGPAVAHLGVNTGEPRRWQCGRRSRGHARRRNPKNRDRLAPRWGARGGGASWILRNSAPPRGRSRRRAPSVAPASGSQRDAGRFWPLVTPAPTGRPAPRNTPAPEFAGRGGMRGGYSRRRPPCDTFRASIDRPTKQAPHGMPWAPGYQKATATARPVPPPFPALGSRFSAVRREITRPNSTPSVISRRPRLTGPPQKTRHWQNFSMAADVLK